MNNTSPISLTMERVPSDSLGKIAPANPGQMAPHTDGPRRMPAPISPMTAGWPALRNSQPAARVSIRIMSSCSRKRAKGWSNAAFIRLAKLKQGAYCLASAVRSMRSVVPPLSRASFTMCAVPPSPSPPLPSQRATRVIFKASLAKAL